MSAWPEAVYVINNLKDDIDSAMKDYFNIDQRLSNVENRHNIIDDSNDNNTPVDYSGTTFSEGSLWFVTSDVTDK